MATKIKTIVTTNEIKRPTHPTQVPPTQPETESNKRRSNRTKQATSKVLESMPSPTRNNLTNGIPRSSRSPAAAAAAAGTNTNAKYQNNLLAELSKKSTNYSTDVVSDLEEILGSPIKTHDNRSGYMSRKHAKAVSASPKKASSTLRSDYNKASMTDDEAKPATRSSKRLSGRAQPISIADPKPKATRNSSTSVRGNAKKPTSATTTTTTLTTSSSSVFQSAAMLCEESQGCQDESYSNLHMETTANENIVINVKQEKEVSFTLTDDNAVFTCEMCSAVFSDRAQLLVHVPVHI